MRARTVYILCIALLLLIALNQLYSSPQKFVWQPTFDYQDKQPFGCYVFDSIVKEAFPQNYRVVTNNTLYQWSKTNRDNKENLLLIDNTLSTYEIKLIKQLVDQGTDVVLVSDDTYALEDSLYFGSYQKGYFSLDWWKRNIQEKKERIRIDFHNNKQYPPGQHYYIPSLLCERYMTDSIDHRKLISIEAEQDTASTKEEDQEQCIAITDSIGKGKLIFVSTPLLFTNYAILDNGCREVITHILSEVTNKPLVRINPKSSKIGQQSPSIISFILRNKSLRNGFYLSEILIVIFFIFSMKRRQRVIPVINKRNNSTITFVKHIGSLLHYYDNYDDIYRIREQNNKYKKETNVYGREQNKSD